MTDAKAFLPTEIAVETVGYCTVKLIDGRDSCFLTVTVVRPPHAYVATVLQPHSKDLRGCGEEHVETVKRQMMERALEEARDLNAMLDTAIAHAKTNP
jgi:hypothetical protein